MTPHIYILRGGLWGFDGPATSAGMDALARQITAAVKIAPRIFNWSDYFTVAEEIKHVSKLGDKLIIIGYSGGGTRAVMVADEINPIKVDLLVLYDPSPRWQMSPIKANVVKAVNYYNTIPFMPSPFGMLGGGCLAKAPNVEIVTIAEQHLLVQTNQKLHAHTVEAIKSCLTA